MSITAQWVIGSLLLPVVGYFILELRRMSAKIDSYSAQLLHVGENAAVAKDRTDRCPKVCSQVLTGVVP